MENRLHIDLETFCSKPIGVGVHKYTRSPDFRIQLFGYAWNDNPVEVIDLEHGEKIGSKMIDLLLDPDITKVAHNAAFEMVCLYPYVQRHITFHQWINMWECTMVKCLAMGLPSKLEFATSAIDSPLPKLSNGPMKYFCKPQKRKSKHTWDDYIKYNIRDVEAERHIDYFLDQHGCLVEWDQWRIDQRVNNNGVPIDLDFCRNIVEIDRKNIQKELKKSKNITGLDNPNSMPALKKWLAEKKEIIAPSLDKDTIISYLEDELLDAEVRTVLEVRQKTSNTSTAKYKAMLESEIDGRVYGCLAFLKAHTGRWASYIVQFQNLPKMKRIKDRDVLLIKNMVKRGVDPLKIYGKYAIKEMIRPAITSNTEFAAADFSAIEARVLAWLAGETWVNEVFATHGKIYEQQAVRMYNLESIDDVTPELRDKGKTATLALGYQGAGNALEQMGFEGTEEEKEDVKDRYRKENKNICAFWYYLNAVVIKCIKEGGTYNKYKVIISRDSLWLKIQLPSGRVLRYYKPHLSTNRWGKESIGYWGVEKGVYKHLDTYGGKIAENITQAVARDCLCVVLKRLDTRGTIVFHVHDEIIMENVKLEIMVKAMEWPIPWARDLVLKAEGYTSKFYKKE